jgi:uncharacterized protein YkwD/uncharacterized membrane protein required for colicin V production
MNIADIVIILFVLAFAASGYFKGAIRQVADIISLVLAIFVSVVFYNDVAVILSEKISVDGNIAKLFAFFIVWMVVQFIFKVIFHLLYPLIPELVRRSKINKILGALPGLFWGVIFTGLMIMVLAIAPVEGELRDTVVDSVIGKYVMGESAGIENYVSGILGGAVNETLTFLTVKPNSSETLDLGFKVSASKLSVDEEAEYEMLNMVNQERTSRGLKALVMDTELQEVARMHSKDMFVRGFFAHVNPDGKDPFDRMSDAGIVFRVAGENLALAPNVELAHQGLMNSPGHRANILTAEFGHIGIGCIDGGSYGKMFSQEFTN